MAATCFVCNLPIMQHQVGLVWSGGNGWDDMMREQLEESTIRARLGGRRDSSAQATGTSPPSTSPAGAPRRRRSSLAQLTDILREWSGGGSKRSTKAPLNRRETLADLARSLPWGRTSNDSNTQTVSTTITTVGSVVQPSRKRRESSAEVGLKNSRSRRDSHSAELSKLWARRESPNDRDRERERDRDREETSTGVETSPRNDSRRGSGESYPSSSRRDSAIGRSLTPPPPKVINATRKRNDSLIATEIPNLQESRPSTSSTASDSNPINGSSNGTALLPSLTVGHNTVSTGTDSILTLPPPTIITSSVTPPATSPTGQKGRRDSTTQCGRISTRRDSKTSPDRTTPRLQRLQRQATTYDDSCAPKSSRRGSQPALSPDADSSQERRARRDSLSPDSASRGRRDSRTHLSPDRSQRDYSPRRRERIRRQSSSTVRTSKSPESSSCCSSRDASPCARPPPPPPSTSETRPMIRRQSTTEEILISRGFRRQSTTEEMIRCRNFRRQSSQSDDVW